MKAKFVEYSRVKDSGNFERGKIGITIELEKGDLAQDALRTAKAFVVKSLGEVPSQKIIDEAKAAIALAELASVPF